MIDCFAGLGFVSFYLAGKMRLFDERGHVYKPLIALIPLLGAILVGISRIDNYRHHWEDVATGGGIGKLRYLPSLWNARLIAAFYCNYDDTGLLLAYFAYRLYFPSLTHSECEKPFPASPVAATISTVNGQNIAHQTTPSKSYPIDPTVLAEEGKQAHYLQHP